MTKLRGLAVSLAPEALGVALAMAGLALPASAACTNNSGGSFTCSSSETTQQSLTANGAPLTVTAGAGLTFSAAAAGRSAFILTSDTALSFTQAAGGGAISGNVSGIRATNNGAGAMSVTATGDVLGTTGAGIFLVNQGNGLTVNAANVTGFVHGINANNPGSGSVTVNASGTVTATRIPVNATSNSTGISVNQVGGTDITINANMVSGGTFGISANNQAGTTGGNTTINVAGDVSGGTGAPVGQSGAVFAAHDNGGDLSISVLGTASSTVGSGIVATTTARSGAMTVDVNDVTAALDGLNLTHAGAGPLAVTVTGDVAAGSGAAILNAAASKGGTFTLAAGGSLQAASGTAFNDAADGSAGSAGSTLDVAGTLGGNAAMGRGADTIQLRAGASLATGTLLDGDAGAASYTAGEIDTLDFAGWSGTIDPVQIANQELVLLSGAADVTFSGGALSNANVADGLTMQTGASTLARFAANFTIGGSLTNLGALDLSTRNGTANTAVSVAGDYAGGGQFVIDVDFAADLADQLLIGGDVSGTTYVVVSDVSSGLASGNNIVFATVGGATAAGDFVLASGPISAGAYTYDAQLLGAQWVLGAVAGPGPGPALNATAALYESAGDILLGGFATLPTFQQRVGQRQWLTAAGGGTDTFQGIWLRSTGNWADVTPALSSAGAAYERQSLTLQAGADFDLGEWVLGVTGQYGTLDADVTNALGMGTLDGHGYGIGATATWTGSGGSYLDLQGQANWISADFATAATGALLTDADMRAYSASVEAGHRFAVAPERHLVPQVQLSWGRLDAGRFTDSQGSAVDLGQAESLVGRVGLAYEATGIGANRQGRLYAVGSLLHDFSGAETADLAGTALTSKTGGSWVEIGFGAAMPLGNGADLYAEGSYRTAIGGGSGTGYALNLGFRRAF